MPPCVPLTGLWIGLAPGGGGLNFGTYGGGPFAFHSAQSVVSSGIDATGGGARAYHAFPTLLKLGGGWLVAHMTSDGHGTRRGDIVIRRSSDLSGASWSELSRFAATRPAGTIQVGDREFRHCEMVDLGGEKILAVLHVYDVTNASDLSAGAGNKVGWSVSTDGGSTWSAVSLLAKPPGATYMAQAGRCVLWNGYVYVPCYDSTSAGRHIQRAALAGVLAGSPTWTTIAPAGSLGGEQAVLPEPGNESGALWWVLRISTSGRIAVQRSEDGTTWADWNASADNIYFEVQASANPQSRPDLCRIASGRWLMPQRRSSGSLGAQLYSAEDSPRSHYYSGDGTPDNELWTVTGLVSWPIPGDYDFASSHGLRLTTVSGHVTTAAGQNKLMYARLWPLGGDLAAVAYALETCERYAGNDSSGGHRCGVYFGFVGAGRGNTPAGVFSPSDQILESAAFDLDDAPSRFVRWVPDAGDTFAVGDGAGTKTLELLAQPDLSDSATDPSPGVEFTGASVTGSIDWTKRNVATVSPGLNIVIAHPAPRHPLDIIPGDDIHLLLEPSGLQKSGSTVTGWNDSGPYGHVLTKAGSPTVGTTQAGADCWQGVAGAYLTGLSNVNLHAVLAWAYHPNTTWSYETIVVNAVQGGSSGTTRSYSAPFGGQYHHLQDFTRYDGTQNPQGWHLFGAWQRGADPQSTIYYSGTACNLAQLFSQSGIRSWTGKVAALLLVKNNIPTDRQMRLLDLWGKNL